MKRIITLLILLAPLLGYSQNLTPQGTVNGGTRQRGGFAVDSMIRIPDTKDTTAWFGVQGNLAIRPQDGKLYYRSNGSWKSVDNGGGNDTTSNVFSGTLSQARAITTTPDVLIISDYGGGVFYKNDTVTVDNTGTQIITAGGQGYSRILDGYVIPEWWGAKGDSITDDTDAMQAALDFELTFKSTPDKVYLTEPLVSSLVNKNIEFTGSRLKLKANQNSYVLTLSGEGTNLKGGTFDGSKSDSQTVVDGGYGNACIYINNSNITVDGVIATQSIGIGIKGSASDYVTVKNSTVLDFVVQGIFIEGQGRDCIGNKIINNTVFQPSNSGVGIYLKGDNNSSLYYQKQFEVSSNQVYGALTGATTKDPCITVRGINGIISENQTIGGDMGISADIATNCAITNNRIDSANGPTGYGIEANGSNNTISNNVMVGGKYSIILSSSDASGTLPLDNNVINANICLDASVIGIMVSAGAGSYTANNLTITNNLIKKSTGNLINLVRNCKYANISNNTFIGGGSSVSNNNGVFLDNVNSNVTVSNNDFNKLQGMVIGYNISATPITFLTVTNNTMTNDCNTSNPLGISGTATYGSNCIVKDNITTAGARKQNYADRATNVYNQYFNGANPNGTLTAGVGSYVFREAGGLGNTLHIKETGIGNTGWGAAATVPYLVANQYAKYTDRNFDTSIIRNLGNDLGVGVPMSIGNKNSGEFAIRTNDSNRVYIGNIGYNVQFPKTTQLSTRENSSWMLMRVGSDTEPTQFRRNVADGIPALSARNQNASGQIIQDFQNAGGRVAWIDINGRLTRRADTFVSGGKDFIVKNRTNGRDEIFSGDSIYTKSQTDSAIAAGLGGSYTFSNGIRQGLGDVKLGLELAPPFTNGLITEPTYMVAGDVLSGAIYGVQIDPTSVSNPFILGGKIRDTDVTIGFGDPTGSSPDNTMDLIVSDGLGNRTDFRILKDSISIISDNPDFSGMVYAGDHSTRFNSDDRAIPDVGWVKQYVSDTNVVSGSADVDFSTKGCYTFTGTTGIWDLMPATTQTTTTYKIANMGSGNLTINAPINTLWEAGALMSSSVIAAGETALIWSNGTYWIIQ